MGYDLELSGERGHRYLVVDVHGFDRKEEGLVVEIKPAEDRGEPSDAPLRLGVISGISVLEFSSFAHLAANLVSNSWHRLEDEPRYFLVPFEGLPWKPPFREEMLSKIDIWPELPPDSWFMGDGERE